MADTDGWDVTVLLGSDWEALEHHNTRWKQTVLHWARRDDVSTVTVVDLPRWSWRRAVRPRDLVEERTSWHPDVRSFRLVVPLPDRPLPVEGVLWRALARRLDRSGAGGSEPRRRLVVAATPLSLELLRHWPSVHGAFDAVDDWRDYEPAQRWRRRIESAYRHAKQVSQVSTVSPALTERLGLLGVTATTVPNGAPTWPADLAAQPAPAGLPDQGFAVYVGNIEGRLDLDAVASLRNELPDLPVVMAGRADPEIRGSLERLGVVLTGPIAPDLVAGLLGRACVGLLPHRGTGLTLTQSSMKVYEYLAAGLPVATTSPTESELAGVVVQAADETYGAAVARALIAGGPQAESLRRWSDVADELWDLYTS